MKKTTYKKIITAILSVFILFSAMSVFADSVCDQETGLDSSGKVCYIPLEKNAFPGMTTSAQTVPLSAYLGLVFDFGIAIAVVLALVMIIWGGIMLMTTDSWEGKSEGKAKIQNALWGLGLALISWLLLYTINPDLVNFNNNTLLYPAQTTTK
jgi:hypothetical protein